MDHRLTAFIDRVEAFVPKVRALHTWDADEAARGARELRQFGSVESVPFDFWDEYRKHFISYPPLPSELDAECAALLAFIEEQKRESLERPHKTDWP